MITEGTVAFASLKDHDVYQGKSTGKYTLTLTMSDSEAQKLEKEGVKVKSYEGNAQRKFSSQYDVPVVDANDLPFTGNVPRGSKVRVLWAQGKAPHPVHGVSTYLSRVRVLEVAEDTRQAEEGF